MSDNYFLLYANCIPVKGVKKSIICDLQRGSYTEIENDLLTILNLLKKNSIESVISNNAEFEVEIRDIIKKLVDMELGFVTQSPKSFIALPVVYDYPAVITNCLIDIDRTPDEHILHFINQIIDIGCKHFQFRSFQDVNVKVFYSLLDTFENTRVQNVELLIKYTNEMNETNLADLFKNYYRINSCLIHTAPYNNQIANKHYSLTYSKNTLTKKSCGFIHQDLFSVNINTYTESQKHNSCLNRKIALDEEGNIKNCPSMSRIFGNVNNTTLLEVLQNQGFKDAWDINKNKISVCKVCEFRHICTDCRAYIENPDDIYSKPLKCGYNPYIGQWEKWSDNPLKKSAIEYYRIQP